MVVAPDGSLRSGIGVFDVDYDSFAVVQACLLLQNVAEALHQLQPEDSRSQQVDVALQARLDLQSMRDCNTAWLHKLRASMRCSSASLLCVLRAVAGKPLHAALTVPVQPTGTAPPMLLATLMARTCTHPLARAQALAAEVQAVAGPPSDWPRSSWFEIVWLSAKNSRLRNWFSAKDKPLPSSAIDMFKLYLRLLRNVCAHAVSHASVAALGPGVVAGSARLLLRRKGARRVLASDYWLSCCRYHNGSCKHLSGLVHVSVHATV
jgi:hypothetical protein